MFGIPVYTILVVLAIIMVADAALLWAIWPHKVHGKTIHMVDYHQKTYEEVKASGKCRHNRCRRHSRQRPINGAWRS